MITTGIILIVIGIILFLYSCTVDETTPFVGLLTGLIICVGALWEVMPEQIAYSDFKPFPLGLFKGVKEAHSKYGHYWIQYFDPEHGGAYVQTNGNTPLEAAYNMVVWLLENGYIKKEE